MYAEKRDSMIKNALTTLCFSNGWCYGIFWGFDLTNSLLLTFKEAYYEEQIGALINGMRVQAHVLGGGVIGQAAFMKNHRWMYSDALHEMQNSLGSFDSLDLFQDDSELFWQFSMGIKTISVISVEPWGVVQLGSTHKNHETEGFVDQVKELFREINKGSILENESHSDSQHFLSNTEFNSLFSGGICNSLEQNMKNTPYFEGFMEANDSFVLPSQSFPSTSNNQTTNFIFPTNSLTENSFQIDSTNLFDCYSSWPINESLSNLMDYESWRNSSLNAPLNLEDFDDFSRANEPVQSSSISGNYNSVHKPENLPTTSLQSSVTDAFRSCNKVKDTEMDNVLDTLRIERGRKNERLTDALNFTSNSLFSQLGIDHLLDGVPSTSSSSAAKRRKIDNFSWSCNQVKFENFERKMKSLNSIELDSEDLRKEAHSCVGKTSTSRGQEEQVKSKKKKAKPGTRPRPKDRQMIQDRLSELRELIPSGEKMSIDRLLERTTRHLTFMQSLTNHATSLKQIDTPKSVEVKVIKNGSSNSGVTWACEVGDHSMACPLIVEDLSTPGQMLIEMLCEEQGFFLEIVDIIRRFGLTIRKGVMEVRETNKIWAHFMVEAEGNRYVSRHEIFSSLIQLLQMTGQGASHDNHDHDNVMNSGMPAFNNFEAFPINFPDALQCGSL